MAKRIKVIDVELSHPLADIANVEGYEALQCLLRLHDVPIGYVKISLTDGGCPEVVLGDAILEQHGDTLRRLLSGGERTSSDHVGRIRLADFTHVKPPVYRTPDIPITVAVCTRDHPSELSHCLESLSELSYPALDLLVVDNAPSSDAAERLVRANFPNMRYVCEPRPGLNWARNRTIVEAQGEIIAFTDDDVVADTQWISALAATFAKNTEVMAVTGLVVPLELETEAQIFFEEYGGFGCWFERKCYCADGEMNEHTTSCYAQMVECGTGANMAYRRSVFEQIGLFDPALDVGTVTNG